MNNETLLFAELWEPLKSLVTEPQNPSHTQVLAVGARCLTESAACRGLHRAVQLSTALEVFLHDLVEKQREVTPSILLSTAQAIDTLKFLFDHGDGPRATSPTRYHVIAVDDDLFARCAIKHALHRVGLKTLCLDDPNKALHRKDNRTCHLFLLDIEMPGINGFELCSQLRALPAYRHTPIIFLTMHDSYDYRTESSFCGADDFLTKPFLATELAVKALSFILRSPVKHNRGAEPTTFSRRDINTLKQKLLGSLTTPVTHGTPGLVSER